MDQFDYRAYPKGGWVLHMIRSQIGPELFRKVIKSYLERHRNSPVVTQDLANVLEEQTGRSWDEFFDQWVFHGGEPALLIAYAWDQVKGQAKLTVQQTQKVSDAVLLFDFPLPVRFMDQAGAAHDFTLRVHEAREDYFFALPSQPVQVRIDPGMTVLAKIEFEPAEPLLLAQGVDPADMMGRLLVARALGGRTDSKSMEFLKARALEDPFYGVRIEAVRSLGKNHTPEGLKVLLECLAQEDDRVRQAVVRAVAGFYSGTAQANLHEIVTTERNPEIVADALKALGKFPGAEVRDLLTESLNRSSYRERIAVAAIEALRQRSEPESAGPLLAYLQGKSSAFTSSDLGRAWDSLAYLGRNAPGETRDAVRIYLADQVDHPKESLRRSAIAALGTLEDERSAALLRSLVDAGTGGTPESKAAEAALKKIHADREQAQEVEDLRKEVLSLQKELRGLKDGMAELRKQISPEPAKGKSP